MCEGRSGAEEEGASATTLRRRHARYDGKRQTAQTPIGVGNRKVSLLFFESLE